MLCGLLGPYDFLLWPHGRIVTTNRAMLPFGIYFRPSDRSPPVPPRVVSDAHCGDSRAQVPRTRNCFTVGAMNHCQDEALLFRRQRPATLARDSPPESCLIKRVWLAASDGDRAANPTTYIVRRISVVSFVAKSIGIGPPLPGGDRWRIAGRE